MRTALVPLNMHNANVAVLNGQAGWLGRAGWQAGLIYRQGQVGWLAR